MNEGELGLRRGDDEGLDPLRADEFCVLGLDWVGEVGTKDERAKLSLLSPVESEDEEPWRREERRWWRPEGDGRSIAGAKPGEAGEGSRTRTMVSLDEVDRWGSLLMLTCLPNGSGALTDPRRVAMRFCAWAGDIAVQFFRIRGQREIMGHHVTSGSAK